MGRKKRKVVDQQQEVPPPLAGGGVDGNGGGPPLSSTMLAASAIKMEMSSSPAIAAADPLIPRSTDPRLAMQQQGVASQPNAAAAITNANTNNAAPSIQIKSATISSSSNNDNESPEDYLGSVKPASQYGLHSHSGDLVEDDIYVSDGSLDSDEDEQDENENEGGEKKPTIELILTTSKMGLMRRGGISSLLGAPQINRTWVRPGANDENNNNEGGQSADGEQIKREGEAEEESEENLDPAQRLALQQRKIEQAKINARIVESSENAGRDPCLFSKRTAFDIRMDQVDEKPWNKGEADMTDYFNYGMVEEDWIEYGESQLAVRQELTDASKQKRLPDPGIVPVMPRAPKVQGDRVAVRTKKLAENEEDEDSDEEGSKVKDESDDEDGGLEMCVELGPLGAAKKEEDSDKKNKEGGDEKVKMEGTQTGANTNDVKQEKIVGGAWGAGASQDSVLLRLIQQQSGGGPVGPAGPGNNNMLPPPPHHGMGMGAGPPPPMMNNNMPPPNMMPPHHAPPPQQRNNNMMPPHQQDRGMNQDQFRNNNDNFEGGNRFGGGFEGGGNRFGGANGDGPWKQDRFNGNNFNNRPGQNGMPDEQQQYNQQQAPPSHHGGRGDFNQQQGFRGDQRQQQQFRQQQQQHRGPPPDQFHQRGGQGPPPPHGRFPPQQQQHQQQQGHWGGPGGGNNSHGGHYPPQRGGPPQPQQHRGGTRSNINLNEPPPNWDQNRKRGRNDFGAPDPRGNARRGRW